jgi:hypothetical protein
MDEKCLTRPTSYISLYYSKTPANAQGYDVQACGTLLGNVSAWLSLREHYYTWTGKRINDNANERPECSTVHKRSTFIESRKEAALAATLVVSQMHFEGLCAHLQPLSMHLTAVHCASIITAA